MIIAVFVVFKHHCYDLLLRVVTIITILYRNDIPVTRKATFPRVLYECAYPRIRWTPRIGSQEMIAYMSSTYFGWISANPRSWLKERLILDRSPQSRSQFILLLLFVIVLPNPNYGPYNNSCRTIFTT